jgi:hypothetical protein
MKSKDQVNKKSANKDIKKSSNAGQNGGLANIIYWLFLVILAVTPVILIPSLQNSAILSKYIFSIYGLSFISALWCFQTAKSGKIDKIPFGMGIPFLLFGLLWLVPSLFKSNRLLSLYAGLPMLFWLGSAFILSHYLNQQKKITCLVGAIIFGGSLCALYGLMQYLNLDFFLWERKFLCRLYSPCLPFSSGVDGTFPGKIQMADKRNNPFDCISCLYPVKRRSFSMGIPANSLAGGLPGLVIPPIR